MRRFAFFDLDETLIRCKSLLGCHAVLAGTPEHLAEADWRGGTGEVRQWLHDGVARGEERDVLNRAFYRRYFSGVPVEAARKAAHAWHARMRRSGLYHDMALAALARCRLLGYEPVIVTGSFREVVAPVAAELGIGHVLCAPLIEEDGCYTGLLDGAPMIGHGKRDAVARFVAERGSLPAFCLGFGDDSSDVPFLSYLGRAYYCGQDTAAPPEWVRQSGLSVLAEFDTQGDAYA